MAKAEEKAAKAEKKVTEANNTIATLQSDNDAKTKKIAELKQLLGL